MAISRTNYTQQNYSYQNNKQKNGTRGIDCQQNAIRQCDTRRNGSSTILMNVTLMLADVVQLSVIQLNVVARVGPFKDSF